MEGAAGRGSKQLRGVRGRIMRWGVMGAWLWPLRLYARPLVPARSDPALGATCDVLGALRERKGSPRCGQALAARGDAAAAVADLQRAVRGAPQGDRAIMQPALDRARQQLPAGVHQVGGPPPLPLLRAAPASQRGSPRLLARHWVRRRLHEATGWSVRLQLLSNPHPLQSFRSLALWAHNHGSSQFRPQTRQLAEGCP